MTSTLREGDPTQLGPYGLQGRLGGGGMGQVFLGRSPGGRLVAVKAVRPELAEDSTFRRRFAAEIAAARRVGGFYTAQVVDADTDGEPPWLATAYIPGPSLHAAVVGHGPLPAASVRVLGAGLAEGLAAVHACGVVHRDLKPANVILAEDGPRLIDFGIARALDATSYTRTHTVLGTAAFMSPEQARVEEVGPASDVFSLGCVLAFAATGRSPFGEGPAHAVAYRVVHTEPDLDGVPEPLTDLVRACLAKDPVERPVVAEALAELSAPTPAGEPGLDRGRWLPDDVTEAIAEHRTLALTAVGPHRSPTGAAGTPAPPQTPVAPEPRRQERPRLLANERRRTREAKSPYSTTGHQVALYTALALFTLASITFAALQFDSLVLNNGELSIHYPYSSTSELAVFLFGIQVVSGFGTTVCWLLWFFQVRTTAERFAPEQLRYRPSMAVYAWFVPFGNLFLPRQIADDIWHASSPPNRRNTMAPPLLLHTWWALWLTTFLVGSLWSAMFLYRVMSWVLERGLLESLENGGNYRFYSYLITPGPWTDIVLNLSVAPTEVATALFVRRLRVMQETRISALPEREEHP